MGKSSSAKIVCMVFVFCSAAAIPLSAQAQTFTTLANFNGTNGFGFKPILVQGTDGNFYGTTGYGGDFTCNITLGMGCGTVFKITPGGTLATLHAFSGPDGWIPSAGVVQATDGNFYGATEGGGANSNSSSCIAGCGTVFKITPAGTLTTLYNFCAQTNCADGSSPGGLVQATDGNFYGTSSGGGNNSCSGGCGTVFGIAPSGKLSKLYNFCAQTNCADGYNPSVLVQATDGNFYGTNSAGGLSKSNCTGGCGTVFRITLGGALTTLHSFNFADGWIPCSLVQGTDGNFYGTTQGGGANSLGTVFKITPAGTLTTLHSFGGNDGGTPVGPLVQATDGNFYGTTDYGGNLMCNAPHGCGVIFKITPGGALTTLHNFIYADGTNPGGGLAQGTDGNFYGATFQGGNTNLCNTFGCGTVFSLSVGLGPFVETIPTSGAVGTAVIILGNNLTGATGVSFNGTPATFTVVSSSEIQTTVPAGATTGVVQVTTPSGTLNSNMPFQVTKTRKRLVQVTSE